MGRRHVVRDLNDEQFIFVIEAIIEGQTDRELSANFEKTFGQPPSSHGVLIEWIPKSRIEIDAARLIVLNAAVKIDAKDAKYALKEIAEAKVMVPNMALAVIDRAVQAHDDGAL